MENPRLYIDTNVTGTLNLLDLCRQFGIKKFVSASSSSLYGASNVVPFHEDDNTDRTFSPYAASKKAAEALCYSYHHLYGMDVSVLRYFIVYGPARRPDMSPFRFVQWMLEGRPITVDGDGRQSRDFTFIDDIARGTLAALKPLGYEVMNLGSDAPVMLMDSIRMMEELTGVKAHLEFRPRHPADVQQTRAHIGKAERLLGWRPQVSYRDGISALINWYRANRTWAKDVLTD